MGQLRSTKSGRFRDYISRLSGIIGDYPAAAAAAAAAVAESWPSIIDWADDK